LEGFGHGLFKNPNIRLETLMAITEVLDQDSQ
jgi:hypothetical protein